MSLNYAPLSFYIGWAGIAFTFLVVATACKNHDRRAFHALLRFGMGVAVSIALGLLIPALFVVFNRISPDSPFVSAGAAFAILSIVWFMREAKRDLAMSFIHGDVLQLSDDTPKERQFAAYQSRIGRRRIR